MSTSRLQRYVSAELGKHLGGFLIYENKRPEWLYGSELDFFLPELNTAIEVQGNQHFSYVEHFHGTYQNYLDQKRRDIMKKDECRNRAITLYEVCTEIDADLAITEIKNKIEKKTESIFDYYNTEPIEPIEGEYSNDEAGMLEKLHDYILNLEYNEKKYFYKSKRLLIMCMDNQYSISDPLIKDFYLRTKNLVDPELERLRNSKKRMKKSNPELWNEERRRRCAIKIAQHESGEVLAPEEKIAEWKRIVAGGDVLPVEIRIGE